MGSKGSRFKFQNFTCIATISSQATPPFDNVFVPYSSDIDECTTGVAQCHYNASCVNFPGSFSCVCDSGYTGDSIVCNGKLYVNIVSITKFLFSLNVNNIGTFVTGCEVVDFIKPNTCFLYVGF